MRRGCAIPWLSQTAFSVMIKRTAIAPRDLANNHLAEPFLNQLAVMLSAEKQLTKAIPILIKAARSNDLKELLKLHLEETKGHVKTIQDVADSLGKKIKRKHCRAMTALIEETVMSLTMHLTSEVRDALLIAAGRKVEHYEIASYGTLCSWAKQQECSHELALLLSVLRQEKLADALLEKLSTHEALLATLIENVSLRKAAGLQVSS